MDPKRNPKLAAVPPLAADRAGGRKPAPGSPPGGPVPPGKPATAAARRAAAAQPPGFAEALERLSRDLKQLQVDFERFFNGALPYPPDELRASIQSQLRTLRGATLTAAADSFRLADLEARFNTYSELFHRRLRDREEGRRPPRPGPAPPAARRFDPARGVVVSGAVEPEAAEALYQGLAAAGETRFDLGTFHSYLDRQAAAIRAKTGCSEVQFRLAEEDGKVRLKARPIGAPAGP